MFIDRLDTHIITVVLLLFISACIILSESQHVAMFAARFYVCVLALCLLQGQEEGNAIERLFSRRYSSDWSVTSAAVVD